MQQMESVLVYLVEWVTNANVRFWFLYQNKIENSFSSKKAREMKSRTKTLCVYNLKKTSCEVKTIDSDKRAAKISKVKVGGPWHIGLNRAGSADILFNLQTWPLISLQPFDQNQFLLPHMKDLFHICLETKGQDFWVTFKVPYACH